MLRLSAVLLVLTATTAWAGESLESRVHAAAVKACVPEAATNRPVSHYVVITNRCIARISDSAMAKYQATAEARLQASTAANN
ncbi:MAG: hypothetical protein ABI608_10070 [Rhizomicrobium sp.]